MLGNYDIDITDLIQISSGGLVIADFVQIKNAIITRYKNTYGDDIDVSTATADGVFINDLSLMINNILQSVRFLYNNLDVNTANGVYLDNLCSLSNVTRKEATNSTASIDVQNIGNVQYSEYRPIFIDKAGTEWVYDGTLTIEPNEKKSIIVSCTIEGPVQAKTGWIDKTPDVNSLIITQPKDAVIGLTRESDNSLRARRSQSLSSAGVTVMDSLIGALLNISGIRDCYIYNNNSSEIKSNLGNINCNPHSIFIALRYEDNIVIDDSIIGNLIFNKLTPGITTGINSYDANKTYNEDDCVEYQTKYYFCKVNGTTNILPTTTTNWEELDINGTLLNYNYVQDVKTVQFNTKVFWKKCTPVAPEIQITISTSSNFNENSQIPQIAANLFNYLNNLSIGTDLSYQTLSLEVAASDTLFLSKPTFIVNDVEIPGSTSPSKKEYHNPITYYQYDKYEYTKSTTSDITTYIIKLSKE